MVPEGRFFDRVKQGREGGERRAKREEKAGSRYRFAVGVSDSDKPGTVGYQAANAAVDALGTDPSFAFVVISRFHERNRKTILESIRKVIGDVPTIGAIVLDPIMSREGAMEGGVGVALWDAGEGAEISTHILKLHGKDEEGLREQLSGILGDESPKKYLNVLGVVPHFVEDVGERVERAFLSLSEYVDLAVVGVVGGPTPSPWSITHGWEFFSNHLAIVTIRTDYPFGVFYAYGFHPLVPFEVTRLDGRFIVELDHSPAYEVLSEILLSRGVSGSDLKDRSRLRKVLARFQMAIPDPAAAGRFKATVIRDVTHRGIEIGVGTVEGDTVWLMEADNVEIIKSTIKGATRSLSHLKESMAAGMIFFENYIRIMSLGDDIKREVEGIRKSVPFPFLGVPSAQELVIHHTVLSGLHGGVAAGVLFSNSGEQP